MIIIVLVGLLVFSALYWSGRWKNAAGLLPGRTSSMLYVSSGLLLVTLTASLGPVLSLPAPLVVPCILIGIALILVGVVVFFFAPLPLLPKWLREQLRDQRGKGSSW